MSPLDSFAILNEQQQQPKRDDDDENDNNYGLSTRTKRKRTEILLPPTSVLQQQDEEEEVQEDCNDCFIVVDVDHWMVLPGSIVKKGETVAMAIQKTISINNNRNDITNKQKELELERIDPVITTGTTTTAAAVKHKRPNRRRKQIQQTQQQPTTSINIGNMNTNIHTNHNIPTKPSSNNTNNNENAISLIKERLASKWMTTTTAAAKTEKKDTLTNTNKTTTTVQVTMKAVPSSISVVTKPSTPPPTTAATTSSIKPKDLIPIIAPATGFLRMMQQQQQQKQVNTNHRRRLIGYIEECLHPTILEGMCVVCGERPKATATTTIPSNNIHNTDSLQQQSRSFDTINVNTGPNLTQVTVSGGITMTVSQQEGQRMAQWDANRLFRQQRLSLVLDLDHTLVHATSDVRARSYLGHNTNHNNKTNNNTSAAGVRTIRLPLHEGTTDPSLQLQQSSSSSTTTTTTTMGKTTLCQITTTRQRLVTWDRIDV